MRVLTALALSAALPLLLSARQETGFLNRRLAVKGTTYAYQVYLPANFSKSQKLPVILFLHGAGERGDNGLAQTEVGLGRSLRFHPERWPAIVVMPQCAKGSFWTAPEMIEMALATLDKSMKEFKADPARVYLTGLSMGGYGTFAIGARYPGRFAALIAICGGVRLPRRANLAQTPESTAPDPYAEAAKGIGKTPIWIFHGDADPTVPVSESRSMVAALKTAGADPKYTEYPKVTHNSWDKAYAEEELPKWLFGYTLSRR